MQSLAESLERTPTALLREMARFWELPEVDESGRPSLIDGLLTRMRQGKLVRSVLGRLGREEREALHAVLAAGGTIQVPALTHTYGPLRSPQLAPDDPQALNPTERLHRKGLIFRAFAAREGWQGAVFFVPSELWPYLPRVPREGRDDLPQPLSADGVSAIPAHLSLHRDVACTLALLRREDYLWGEGGDWPEDLLAALATLLCPSHRAYGPFVLHVAQQARLIAPDLEGALRPTAEGHQWLRADPWLRAHTLFRAWREHPTWDDLAAVPALQVERLWPADLIRPRQRVLRHLAALAAGVWFALDDWLRWMEGRDPEFLRPAGAPGRPRVRRGDTNALLKGPSSWNLVEGRFLHFLLQGPLHWLGLVDLGREAGSGEAWRLNRLGEALLSDDLSPPTIVEETLIVEGTFEVWAPLEAPPQAFFVLEGYAEPIRRDRMSRYRLTREALHRALARGDQVETLLQLLSECGRDEVPQNVAYTLGEWAASFGRLRLYRPLLLVAEEAPLLEEVLADPEVAGTVGERLSATVVEIDGEEVRALVERLGRLGHLPDVAGGLLAQRRLALSISSGQAAALLALLWAGEDSIGRGRAAQALDQLIDQLVQVLPPARLAWARRQAARWRRGQQSGDQESRPGRPSPS